MKALRIILIVFAVIILLLALVVFCLRQAPAPATLDIQSRFNECKNSLTIVKDAILNDYQSLPEKNKNDEMYDSDFAFNNETYFLDFDFGEIERFQDVEIALDNSAKNAIKDLKDKPVGHTCVYADHERINFASGEGAFAYIFQINGNYPDYVYEQGDINHFRVYSLGDNWFYARTSLR